MSENIHHECRSIMAELGKSGEFVFWDEFRWGDKIKLKKSLKDVLEDDVDEKYYLNREFNMTYESQANTIHCTERPSAALCAFTHGYAGGYIKVPSATKSGYETATTGDSINLSVPNSKTRRGRVGKQVAQTLDTSCNQAVILDLTNDFGEDTPREYSNFSPTLRSERHGLAVVEPFLEFIGGLDGNKWCEDGKELSRNFKQGKRIYSSNGVATALTAQGVGSEGGATGLYSHGHRIRKLTPRECLRLQDFPDTFKIVVSDSQAYRQAGNSMSVNVMAMIFNQIEKAKAAECRNSLLDFIGETA